VLDSVYYMKKPDLSKAASSVLDAQWVSMRNGIIEQVESRKRQLALAAAPIDRAEALEHADAECPGSVALSIIKQVMIDAAVSSRAAKPIGLSRVMPMIDVSASMTGMPLDAAVALGILASELSHEAFRGRLLTFSDEPVFTDLRGETSFVKKVKRLVRTKWGFTTDFYRAMELICTVVREHELGADDIPDLLIISDMQFNNCSLCEWSSASQNIKRLFHALGLELYGRPVDPPQIIFWNVRSGTVGYPAAADDEGVIMLSGYSPALMKFFLSGEMTEEIIAGVDSAGNAVKERKNITPAEMLNRILSDSGLDDVRVALNAMPAETFIRV
jgi:hypothetical protein